MRNLHSCLDFTATESLLYVVYNGIKDVNVSSIDKGIFRFQDSDWWGQVPSVSHVIWLLKDYE
jgi:hypothetical protein